MRGVTMMKQIPASRRVLLWAPISFTSFLSEAFLVVGALHCEADTNA